MSSVSEYRLNNYLQKLLELQQVTSPYNAMQGGFPKRVNDRNHLILASQTGGVCFRLAKHREDAKRKDWHRRSVRNEKYSIDSRCPKRFFCRCPSPARQKLNCIRPGSHNSQPGIRSHTPQRYDGPQVGENRKA